MKDRYFYGGILSFLFAIIVDSFLPLSPWLAIWLLTTALPLSIYWRRQNGQGSPGIILFPIVVCLGLAAGLIRFDVAEQHFRSVPFYEYAKEEVDLTGLVSREPESRERTQHITLDTDDGRLLMIADRHSEIAYGDVLSVKGRVELPESFTTDLGRTFDYPNYLRAKGITHVMFSPEITVIDNNAGHPVLSFLYDNKRRFMEAINQQIPEPAAGLGLGVLLGIKQALGPELETAFRQAGIIHIVVLSGYNVMLVVLAIVYLLAYVLPVRPRAVVGITAIILFALLVGLGSTVVRASIMACLVLLSGAIGKRYDIMRALALAAAAMVLYQPYILAFDIGFQLSFMATLGLVFIAPYFETMLIAAPTRLGVREFLTATIATQIAVIPLLLFHIGEVSLVSVIVNVLVLPIVPFAMLATALSGAAALIIPTVVPVLALAAYVILMSIIKIALWSTMIPFASVAVPAFSWIWVPAMYLGMGIGLFVIKRARSRRQNKVSESENVPSLGTLDDWMIIEEEEIGLLQTNPNISRRGPSPRLEMNEETPIFFR